MSSIAVLKNDSQSVDLSPFLIKQLPRELGHYVFLLKDTRGQYADSTPPAESSFASAYRNADPPRESSMSKPGFDGRHRNKDGEISGKHGNTLVRTLRKVYGQGFAAGYPETAKLSEVMFHLNETSLKPTPPRSRDGPLGAQDCSGIEMKRPRCRAQ